MREIYSTAGLIYLFLLVAAGIIAIGWARRGIFSLKGIVTVIGGLSVLELGAYVCMWGSFILAGGPDGLFLSPNTLGIGGIFIAVSILAVIFSLRLLSMPALLAALFLSPPLVTIGAQAASAWPITEAAFTAGPVFCLFIVVFFYVVRNLMGRKPLATGSTSDRE